MPDWAIYMKYASRFGIPPWQVEKELTLEWLQQITVWDEEQPKK